MTDQKQKMSPELPDFLGQGAQILPELVKLRREIHQDPELGLENPRTQERVLKALEGLPLEITLGTECSSVTAVLRGAMPGPTVLLRGDMDGLPGEELTGLPYASETGTMHACGHDMHTAGLVGAAHLLSANRDKLAGNVIFMFQPGEEGFGGAQVMINEGVLDVTGERPVGAYAIHVAPGPRGVFLTRTGAACASSNRMFMTIRGRGGHGSQPHLAIDPVAPAAEIVLAIQHFVARKFDAFDPVVCSLTQISSGGNAVNVIPEEVTMGATIRTLTGQSLDKIDEGLRQLVVQTAEAHECEADVEFHRLYPPTINDYAVTEEALGTMKKLLGPQRVQVANSPMMGSEDFAFVLDEVPGTFVAMLATPKDMDLSKAEFNHSPRAAFDDSLLGDQAAVLASLAYGRLAEEANSEKTN